MSASLLLHGVHVCRESEPDCGSARVRLSAAGLASIGRGFGDALRVDVREAGAFCSRLVSLATGTGWFMLEDVHAHQHCFLLTNTGYVTQLYTPLLGVVCATY